MTRIVATITFAVVATIVAGFAVGAMVNFLHFAFATGSLFILAIGVAWAGLWVRGLLRIFEEEAE